MSPRSVPASVFWRRRLILLAVTIGMAWVLVQVFGILRTEPGGAKVVAEPAPDPVAAAPAATEGPVQVALASADTKCDPQKIRVTPTVRPKQLAGGQVQIGLVVSSTETKPCTLQPADADLVAIISANDTPIWDSTLCPTSLLAEPVQVSAQWSTLEVTTWSGRVSGNNCSAQQDFAAAGKYVVEAGTLGGEPGKTTFALDRRPKPAATTPPPAPTTPTPTQTTPAG